MKKYGDRKRAILFSFYILPFMLNVAFIDFMIPVKFDNAIESLPLIGLLVTIACLLTNFLDFAIGDLTDRIGVKEMLQVGVILSFVGTIIFGLFDNFLLMTIGIFIWGLSYVMLTIPADTYIFSVFSKSYRGSAYGWMYFIYDLAYAIAPLAGLTLFYFFGINATIIATAIIVLFTLPMTPKIKTKANECIARAFKDVVYKDGLFVKELKDIRKFNKKEFSLWLIMLVCGIWFMTMMFAAPLLFFHSEGDLFRGALLTFAFMVPFALFEPVYGKLANSRKKRKLMVIYGFLSAVILLSIFFFIEEFVLLFIIALAITLTASMGWAASEIEIGEYLPKGRKGEFMSIFITGKDFGFDLAPLFYGIFATFSLKVPFIILSVLLFGACLLFVIVNRK